VSVRHRNQPVGGLKADAFRLLDNGVEQAVHDVSVEAVPIDLSVFIDTSASFIGRLNDLRADIQDIARLLRANDRFRLLTFGNEVEVTIPWTGGGTPPPTDRLRLGRISSVYDGLAASLLHQPVQDRRHLVIAITDGRDYGSAVSSARLLDMSTRIESVLHLVLMRSLYGTTPRRGPEQAQMRGPDALGSQRLDAVAQQTGGLMHAPSYGEADLVRAFRSVFEDFRSSYVLRYVPAGVPAAGWHDLTVTVPSRPEVEIRARRGYSGAN
jgi:hypothetical protein